jgi:hypothetical protein
LATRLLRRPAPHARRHLLPSAPASRDAAVAARRPLCRILVDRYERGVSR